MIDNKVLFPLRQCELDGVSVMCPAQSEEYLRQTYGSDWRVPSSRADQSFKERVRRSDVHSLPVEMIRQHKNGIIGDDSDIDDDELIVI